MKKWGFHANCYGYATNKKEWLLIEDDYSQGVNELLMLNPNWKLVSRSEVVLGKEYVAYRYCAEDFHFMKRNKQGYWRHKMGGGEVQAISTKKVFAEHWSSPCHYYNSKLYLFEVA